MYTFSIKDNGPDVIVLVTRSLLALGAIITLLYQNNPHYYINVIASAILLTLAVLVNRLFVKMKLKASSLLWIGAVILFIGTRSITFSIVLAAVGLLMKKLNEHPTVHINKQGVYIKKMFGNQLHPWSEFNNIILKDDLLTLDFKNNKLFQLSIVENSIVGDENNFNTLCSGFIGV